MFYFHRNIMCKPIVCLERQVAQSTETFGLVSFVGHFSKKMEQDNKVQTGKINVIQ